MKLHTLNLANFRGFEQLEMSFEPDMTLIAGINGIGKSGILQVLAALFARALPEFTPCTDKPPVFADEDIYDKKPSLTALISFSINKQRCYGGIQRIRGDTNFGDVWRRFWMSKQAAEAQPKTFVEMIADRTLTGDLEAGRSEIEEMLLGLRRIQKQPLVIYFSPRRQLPGRPKTLPKLKAFEIENAYKFAMQDREVELREFMHWFRVVETGASKAHRHGSAVLKKLREVINSFIPEFHNLHIEESPNLRFVVEKNGTPLALNQLSDGERGLLAMLFDITRRLSIANPGLDDPIAEGAGIVLIDEIELHLHPLWQRQVLKRFKGIFTNCQFIATTHSPLVLGEVEARSVRFLERDDAGRVFCTVPDKAYGLDANRVLEELMGARVRTREMDDQLKILFEEIDEEEFDAARQTMKNLREKLGEHDPELTRASALIKFLEGEA